MILVLEINGALLHLFSSAAEVESYVEAIDVENSEYEFCDDSGQRFVSPPTAKPAKASHSLNTQAGFVWHKLFDR